MRINRTDISMDVSDEMMASDILAILRIDLEKVFSWGFQHPKVIKNGVRACVNGFIYQGDIEIKYNSDKDSFEVYIFNDDGTVKDKVEDVCLDSLIEAIDRKVEYCENYDMKVRELYGSHPSQ